MATTAAADLATRMAIIGPPVGFVPIPIIIGIAGLAIGLSFIGHHRRDLDFMDADLTQVIWTSNNTNAREQLKAFLTGMEVMAIDVEGDDRALCQHEDREVMGSFTGIPVPVFHLNHPSLP